MARYRPEQLDPAKPIFVRKPFKAAGRTLMIGQPFDWKKWAVDLRKVQMLMGQRYLTHGTPEVDVSDNVDKDQLQAHKDEQRFADLPKGDWEARTTGIGWFNAFNAQGQPFQEKAMREAAVRELIKDINK